MKQHLRKAVAAGMLALVIITESHAAPLGTVFTHQGRLADGGRPANGIYDFRFTLYDAASGGATTGTPSMVTTNGVAVSNGVFTVSLDFGSAFHGAARWLATEVKTNLAAGYHLLTPRIELTPTPNALYAANAGTASAVAPGAVTSAGLASGSVDGPAIADGSIGAADLSPGLLNSTFWKLSGNTGVGNILGSLDNQPVEIRANNQTSLRIQPTPIGPNLVGGIAANHVAPGVGGAFIGSGGRSAAPNVVNRNYAAVVAGYDNLAAGEASFVGGGAEHEASGLWSVIAGGFRNNAPGDYSAVVGGVENSAVGASSFVGVGGGNYAGGNHSVVAGGLRNKLFVGAYAFAGGGLENLMRSSADYASIVGGRSNVVSAPGGAIGGGQTNQASGQAAVVAGGEKNHAASNYDTVSGGANNHAGGAASVVAGGWFNEVTGYIANIGGGQFNNVAGTSATVAGGANNSAEGELAAIGGGSGNRVLGTNGTIAGGSGNRATNTYATVGGGRANIAGGNAISAAFTPFNHAVGATVSGGESNRARRAHATVAGGRANTVTTSFSAIGGGTGNTIHGIENAQAGTNCCEGASAVISGGTDNTIRGFWNFNSTISGGVSNTIISPGGGATLANVAATIGGGSQNLALGQYSTVPGGSRNQAAGNYSLAAGHRARANHGGSFVWADDTDADFASTTNKQFAVRANNGVMIQAGVRALDLRGGGAVHVAGAGVGSSTPAFIHRATAANITGNFTTINHPHSNGDPNAILIVTPNWNPGGGTATYNNHPIGVFYSSGAWAIFNQDSADMPVNAAFNVLVIKP
jgi:hypothetical protein